MSAERRPRDGTQGMLLLKREYTNMLKNPVEGFSAGLIDDDFFKWEVIIIGPPDTFYEGGMFKVTHWQHQILQSNIAKGEDKVKTFKQSNTNSNSPDLSYINASDWLSGDFNNKSQ